MSQVAVFLIRLLAVLPLSVLYVISDYMLYPIARHVIRYRRAVVEKNIGLAFPDKSDTERLRIEQAFYHHLCDVLVEIVHSQRMTQEELSRRFQWEDIGAVYSGKHKFTLCYLAHYGNWEWLISRLFPTPSCCPVLIYQPQHNATFDQWMCQNRSRFGTRLADMHHVSKYLSALPTHDDSRYAVIAISDQLPKEQYVRHFHRLMGIKTKVLTGTEQLIRHYDMQVVYCHITRPRRGYYVCRTIPLDTLPSSDWPYTDAYFDQLQQQIYDSPELWLWSHDRWRR